MVITHNQKEYSFLIMKKEGVYDYEKDEEAHGCSTGSV